MLNLNTLENSESVSVAKTTGPSLDSNDNIALVKNAKSNGLVHSPLESLLDIVLPLGRVGGSSLLVDEGVDASEQMGESGGLCVPGNHKNGAVGSVLGTESGRSTGCGQNNDSSGLLLERGRHGGDGNGLNGLGGSDSQGSHLVEQRSVSNGLLGDETGLVHHLDGLNGVGTLGGLTRQHDTVSTIENGVTDIGDLGSGGSGVVGHRVKHLGGTDDGLTGKVALGDELLLGNENLGGGDLDTKITSGNHDTVGLLENLVKVVDTLLVLNLGDDLDALALLTENVSDGLDIVGGSNERGKDHVDTVLNTESEIGLVLLGQSGEIDISAGEVDTLSRRDLTVVEGLDLEGLGVNLLDDLEGKNTIVNEDDLANVNLLDNVGVVNVHDLVVANLLVLGVGGEEHDVASLDVPVLVVLGETGSDLGALGVEGNGEGSALELLLGLSGVLNHRLVVLVRAVREVHSHNVETGWVSIWNIGHSSITWSISLSHHRAIEACSGGVGDGIRHAVMNLA